VYKRGGKKRAVKVRVERALLQTDKPVASLDLPALPPGWSTQHDMRAEEQTVRFSVVLQVDVPIAAFDREEANSQARIAGFQLEKNLPDHSRLVFVATDQDEG
jgi:hypothetical protein